MDVGKDKMKDLFSSKLGSFEAEVPASVWGGLDQLLSAEPTPTTDSSSSSTSSSSSGKSSSLKTIVAVVGVTVAIAMGIFFLNREEPKIVFEEPRQTKSVVKVDSIEPIEESFGAEPKVAFKVKKGKTSVPVVVEEVFEEEIEVQDKKEEVEEAIVEKIEKPARVRPEDEVRVIPIREEEKGKGVSIGVVSEMGLTAYIEKGVGGNMLLSQKVRSEEFIDVLEAEGSEFDLKHNKPLSFGIIVEKELSSNLNLQTGLVYTHLSSEVTSSSRYNIKENQTFDYIGVPVALNYTFYKVGGAKFYLSLGGMMQKDIKGKYISHLDLPHPEEESFISEDVFYNEPYYIKKHLKQTNLQFSVRTKLGVAYPLYKKLYIYGAIGGVYYFDANNKYRTIYSDKKTQLDLNLGVKYEF